MKLFLRPTRNGRRANEVIKEGYMNLAKWTLAVGIAGAMTCPVSAALAAESELARRPQYFAYRSFSKQHAMTRTFADMGIKVRGLTLANTWNRFGNLYCDYKPFWLGEGKYDFSQIDLNIGEIVAASPDEKFIVNIDLNTPSWLERACSSDSFTHLSQTAADPYWRKVTLAYLRDTLGYVEKKWGDRVVAYVLMCGSTTEWVERAPTVMTPMKNKAWREWCKARGLDYGPATPDCEALATAAFEGTVYDPVAERAKIDFWHFSEGLCADTLLEFARETRRCIGKGKEIGAFFGYYMTCDWSVHIGQTDWQRVFDSPDLDFFLAPPTYGAERRRCGAGTGPMTMFSSLRLRGKRYLHEIDFDTHTVPPCFDRYFFSQADDLAGNTREAGFALVNHGSLWWFDMWGGFYDDPVLRARIAKLRAVYDHFKDDVSPVYGDILLVADPESAWGTTASGPHSACVPEGVRNNLNRIGCCIDYLAFEELKLVDLAKYKVMIFHASTTITPERRKFLEEKVLRDGRTVVWVFAPGVSDGKTLDPGRVKELTGIAFKTPGVTTVKRDGWTSVYGYDWKLFTPEVLRGICEKAGAHCWTDELLPVAANERLVMVHAASAGRRTIHLPRKCRMVTDLLHDKVVGRDTSAVEVDFAAPDTILLELE